ncbi:MAG: hypothetical protein ACRECQ_08515 [Burkholderiaceae bacterium]
MMIYIEPGVYLRVQQLPHGPHPLPLQSGLRSEFAYRALGVFSPSETSECYFIVANDRDETWFISNRHFRVVGLFPERSETRFSLASLRSKQTHLHALEAQNE